MIRGIASASAAVFTVGAVAIAGIGGVTHSAAMTTPVTTDRVALAAVSTPLGVERFPCVHHTNGGCWGGQAANDVRSTAVGTAGVKVASDAYKAVQRNRAARAAGRVAKSIGKVAVRGATACAEVDCEVVLLAP